MISDSNNLNDLLRRARRRRHSLLVLRGVAVCLGAVAAILLMTGWVAHRYRHNESVVFGLRFLAIATFLAIAYFILIRPLWQRISDARLARLIEEHTPGADDRLVAAIEFRNKGAQISPALLYRLGADANGLAGTVNAANIIRRSKLLAYGTAAVASLLVFAALLKWGPREISQGVTQMVTPSSLAASVNAVSIKVRPGTARVPKGSDQDILATLVNFDSQTVTLLSRPMGSKGDWQGQTMEPAKARSDYRFSVFNIQDSMEYFVESNTVRSEVFRLTVVDLPYVKQLDLVLNFPAFTQLSAKAIEDGGEIAAVKGTVVSVTARLTGKVRAARIVFPDGKKIDMRAAGADFTGELPVLADTTYYIELVSVDGEAYRGSNEFDITVLEDQPPTISFERPGRDKKATNLEEVFTEARAEDDYGVVAIELHFSVNGGDEKKLNLQNLRGESARKLTGAHTFFLEEFGLKPGDFISYYARARDAGQEATSDIYFIEIKPFEMQYRQTQQQGGGQGGGQQGDEEQNALSRRQKDLIAATHRLIREGEKFTPQERKDGYEAVAAGQEKLRADTLEFLDRMGRRLGEEIDDQKDIAAMAEHLKQAAREMESAPPPLRKESGRDALPPEQRALQRLLAADAIFREIQVAFGNQSNGGGGGSQNQSQELAGLFELELDKMKNQYETVQRAQRQQAQQEKTEAERRLEELARRQQQALEEQRRRQQGQPANASGGGNQRQQQELIEETRRAARELERLSRQRRDPGMEELSRQLNQTADEMQRAQASSRANQNESIAQSERALERLRETQNRLQQMEGRPGGQRGQGREQEVSELRQRAAQAAARQRSIAREVEDLARRGGQNTPNSSRAKEQLADRKETLADAVSGLQQDLEQSARGMASGQQRTARQLDEAANNLSRDRVVDRIRESKQDLNGNQLENARATERSIERSLNELSERLQSAEQSARRPVTAGAEEALDKTRQLADSIDSLRRRLSENAQQDNQNGRQQQNGAKASSSNRGNGEQQPGQQQSSGQQSGRDHSKSQSGNQEGTGGSEGGYGGDNRQLASELRERLREAEGLRREWGASGPPSRTLTDVIEQLRRFADGRMEGDAETAAALKADVVEPLRQLELELSKQLHQGARTTLRLRDEGAAPERYRKAVEEYYRRLSSGQQK